MLYQFRTNAFSRFTRRTRKIRWRLTSSGLILLATALISGIIGLDTQQNLGLHIFSIIVATFLITALFSPRKRDETQVTRLLPPLASVGQAFNYRIAVHNLSHQDYSNLFFTDKLEEQLPSTEEFKNYHDPISDKENIFDRMVGFPRWTRLVEKKLGAVEPTATLQTLSANQKQEVHCKLIPLRRGYLNFSEVSIGAPDMFGLFRRFQNISCESRLLVLPKQYALPPLNLIGRRLHHPGGIALASATGDATEFHGLRDYQPGDPLRHIHWRSWAKTGSPIVKTFEQEYFVHHALVLDTFANNVPPHHFEEAVNLAASFVLQLDDQETLLDLMFIGNNYYHITSGRHVQSTQTLLEVLACVTPDLEHSIAELTQMITELSATLSNVICIFLRWDSQRQAMIEALRQQGVNVITLIMCHKSPTNDVQSGASSQQIFYLRAAKMELDLEQLNQLP